MAEEKDMYIHLNEQNRDQVVRIIKRLIQKKRGLWLRNVVTRLHPSALAAQWELFNETEQDILISLLPPEESAILLAELDSVDRAEIFKNRDNDWIFDRLEELDSDDVVDILKELSTSDADFIIRRFSADYSEKIKHLLQYPEETAGALMSSDFITVNQNATVDSIITKFRKFAEEDEIEDLQYIYVVDPQSRLKGYIPIRKLILEKPQKKAKEIMNPPIVQITPDLDQEEVARIFRDYDLISMAVVNEDRVILGRITVDDIVDVFEEEASEDVFRMVGLNKEEKISNSILVSLKHRLPWMFINLFTTSLAALVVGFFQDVLEQFVILAMFMPMVAALGGATGNQMVAMIVRGMAVGDLHWSHVRWILFREVTAVILGSFLIGLVVGLATTYFYDQPVLGYVISLALVMNMVFATLVGAGIPLFLKALRQDPAFGSSILVAATTDMLGFFIFLGLASQMLMN